jgi:hypothetical protein
LVCFEIVRQVYFFIGLKNKGNYLPQRGRQPPCVCRCLSLTCSRSNSMRLLVAAYAKPCTLGLGRGEGKRFFLSMNSPTNCRPLTPPLHCQHTYFVKQRSANSNNEGQRRMTNASGGRRLWTAEEGVRDDRSGQRTMTEEGDKQE